MIRTDDGKMSNKNAVCLDLISTLYELMQKQADKHEFIH